MQAGTRRSGSTIGRAGALLAACCALACAGTGGMRGMQEDRAYQLGLASVERIDVKVMRRPVTVHVNVYGTLPDTCTEIEGTEQQRLGSSFDVTLATRRDSHSNCVSTPRPFEKRILLDVAFLPSGLYSVDVNGVQGSFQILEDLDLRRGPYPYPATSY
jgi:inhibitor of cysteine peptidase